MSKPNKPQRDPRGHSLRVYADVYDSPAFSALSPHDVMAYLALLRELKGYNNGDLSLPLSRAKKCGISHPKTLARSLRALCAVGLVAIARRGGCSRGGQRLPTLYRMTDRECYAIPAKHLEAMKETHDWKRITSAQQGLDVIKAAETRAKKDASEKMHLGHAVPRTVALDAMVKPKTRAPHEPWNSKPGHGVTMVTNPANPALMRATAGFGDDGDKATHRAPRSTPLYVYQSGRQTADGEGHGNYQRLAAKPVHFFTGLVTCAPATTH